MRAFLAAGISLREYSHSLRLESELSDLREANANQQRSPHKGRAWSILMLHQPIQRAHLEGGLFVLAGVAGIEPTLRESKSLAIPLGDTPLYLTYAL